MARGGPSHLRACGHPVRLLGCTVSHFTGRQLMSAISELIDGSQPVCDYMHREYLFDLKPKR